MDQAALSFIGTNDWMIERPMLDLLRQPQTMRDICCGLDDGRCVLCQVDVQTFMDEVACPHWFVSPGYAAFRLRRLAKVFEVYDLDSVLEYLKIVARSDAASISGSAVTYTTTPQKRETIIAWRKRRWEFRQRMTSEGCYSSREFVVSIYYCGEIVENGTIIVNESGQAVCDVPKDTQQLR
ncbi:hypothetical protein [Pseudoduganella lutea]|uniref:Uncharacterized protein n=1 Tax=Pseudoduganella lutea TaxID=321985 RepID=A0A4V0Z4B8_9BURK|nr:hypothetical protein [Pseudoduganella lutea]QBE66393.1 hypothetical protein EWM63_28315 [Pseudoduganella lutea]